MDNYIKWSIITHYTKQRISKALVDLETGTNKAKATNLLKMYREFFKNWYEYLNEYLTISMQLSDEEKSIHSQAHQFEK